MTDNRRPIKARSAGWATGLTNALLKQHVSPNQISVASVLFALIGAGVLILNNGVFGSLICALCIQLRLLCNLLDGMVAIEGGKQSHLGILYNEFPDRVADSVLIVALGYAIGYSDLGWLGALAAALTAYVRIFGGSIGLKQCFAGPMAKQHRMALMTAALLLNAVEAAVYSTHHVALIALAMITLGSLITCGTRTLAITRQLDEHPHVDQ